MNRITHAIIKMLIASLASTGIALLFNVESAITAGILAILSIKLTKTDSIDLALRRFTDALLALLIATLLFVLIGYSMPVFFLFTVIFIVLSYVLKLEEGVVPSLVLANILLQHGGFDTGVLINTFALIAIAISVALLLNVFYPVNSHKELRQFTRDIDALIKEDISLLEKSLRDEASYIRDHEPLNKRLKRILDEATQANKDILFDNDEGYIDYLRMRRAQMKRLSQSHELILRLDCHHKHALTIANYLKGLNSDIGYANKAEDQLKELRSMLRDFRENSSLPKSRSEFETRAVLYQILYELEAFLKDKIVFHESHPDFSKS
ncbi:MAG: aromatic acid exporter family protein, partial [Bacillota bacterium]